MRFFLSITLFSLFVVCFQAQAYAQNPKAMKKHAKKNKKKQKPYDKPLTYSPAVKDTDKDGVPDYYDHCPRTPLGQVVTPFGCPMDRDFDKIVDTLDECPDVKGPKANMGCPWPDTDGDGLLDKDDKCPEEAGPQKNKGCPWSDRDKDEILDKDDLCPDVPGEVKWEGCADRDGDGIQDNEDLCVDVPGVPENKGCPALKKEEQDAVREAFENLLFETGKSIIRSSSYESLNKLAGVMKKNTGISLKLEGHTDDVGEFYDNMRLSDDRAKAVRTYLVRRGVNRDKISTEGFGETRPVQTNETPEGRKANRRVEFILTY